MLFFLLFGAIGLFIIPSILKYFKEKEYTVAISLIFIALSIFIVPGVGGAIHIAADAKTETQATVVEINNRQISLDREIKLDNGLTLIKYNGTEDIEIGKTYEFEYLAKTKVIRDYKIVVD